MTARERVQLFLLSSCYNISCVFSNFVTIATLILIRHRIEVLREIALRLRELSVLPPFQANATVLCQVNIFSNNLHYSTLEFLTTARMPRVRGSKYLDRKRKAAIALEVKVPEDFEVHCCGKWRQDWCFFVKDLRQLSSCYARRICKTSRKYG